MESFELARPQSGEVLVSTKLSMMSTGTENIVFNRLFEKGGHWDSWVKYPFFPGYTAVGEVEEVGSDVSDLKPGTRVAFRVGHRSAAIVEAAGCIPIPDKLSWEEAVWFSLAKIAFHGAHAAKHELGDDVAVIGAGPIGQMAIRWANAAGASSIVVIDPASSRIPLAIAGGASEVIPTSAEEARAYMASKRGSRMPRVVIDSTGNEKVFQVALGLARDFGKIIVLGDTGKPSQQALSSDVIIRGLTICGAHDSHNTPQWNDISITRLFFDLATTGRFNLANLVSHVFAPEDCETAYATANSNRSATMGIVFKWSE